MASRIRLDGLQDALRAVARVPEAMRRARAETLEAWSESVIDGAREKAPHLSGTLKGNLAARVHEQYGRAEVGVWDEPAVEYALYVEKGTSKMTAQPFLVPAFNEARADVVPAYRAAFRRHLGGGE
ncbi:MULTISPECIES: HK97-gp10 family putative phage morphogenesis protein [unclassified Streptomyces]|uniref:HK97-gp10 family putative phage morphogenesis protein n=1 Tax=unclassified Streptomyces TaxID=2593676 RepID=UPI0036639011